MKVNEILFERVINAFSDETKKKYSKEVWNIIQKAYSNVPGGFLSAPNVEELISDTGLWKIVKRGDKVTSVRIYKDSHGRKSIALATDGTVQGLKDFKMVQAADVKLQRSWSEVSGKPELMLIKNGVKAIPAKYASILTGKAIIGYNTDGIHYTRLIGGEPHEKAIFGFIEIDDKLKEKLEKENIDIKTLPDNFKARK